MFSLFTNVGFYPFPDSFIDSLPSQQVNLYSRHIGKTPEQIEEDIRRPKYFSPSEAVEYGIIDKVNSSGRL